MDDLPEDVDELARQAYAAYGEQTSNRNYQGLPMPTFDDLGGNIQQAWRLAVTVVARTCYERGYMQGERGDAPDPDYFPAYR